MKLNKKYRITLEDESSLDKKINFSARFPVLILLLIAFAVLAASFGIFILASTPMKNHLPGYLKEDERTATEEQHLRLDSLAKVYEINEVYIRGILEALNPDISNIETQTQIRHQALVPDSMKAASDVERQFMENIRERDKYNVAISSPAAAQTMLFGNVNGSAVLSDATKNKYKVELILPDGAPVAAVAEGKVISVASSPKTSGGYEVIIQHPKGFLSKTGHLSNLFIHPGDNVAAGQIIAGSATKEGMKKNLVYFELWHDGAQLLPSRYLPVQTSN